MSMLTTRICGYQFSAVTIEKEEGGYSWIGNFVAPMVDGSWRVDLLPFELRGTYEQRDGQFLPIFLAAVDAITELNERTVYTSEFHEAKCDCDSCRISLAMLDREYAVLRGNNY
jgi:hypothetical protein